MNNVDEFLYHVTDTPLVLTMRSTMDVVQQRSVPSRVDRKLQFHGRTERTNEKQTQIRECDKPPPPPPSKKKRNKKKASGGLWRGTFPRRFVHGLEPVHPVTLPSHPQQPQQDARDGQDVVAVYVGDALPASGLAELGMTGREEGGRRE